MSPYISQKGLKVADDQSHSEAKSLEPLPTPKAVSPNVHGDPSNIWQGMMAYLGISDLSLF